MVRKCNNFPIKIQISDLWLVSAEHVKTSVPNFSFIYLTASLAFSVRLQYLILSLFFSSLNTNLSLKPLASLSYLFLQLLSSSLLFIISFFAVAYSSFVFRPLVFYIFNLKSVSSFFSILLQSSFRNRLI